MPLRAAAFAFPPAQPRLDRGGSQGRSSLNTDMAGRLMSKYLKRLGQEAQAGKLSASISLSRQPNAHTHSQMPPTLMDYSVQPGNSPLPYSRLVLAAVVLAVIYVSLPLGAGIFAIGDRRGPRIYPVGGHEILYIVGWELSGREGKPRVLGRGSAERPWFYGL